MAAYSSEQGNIITLEFDPQAGHEQKGRRPAIVVSNNVFDNFTKMAMLCPIMNTRRGFPLHIALDSRTTTGVVMCGQVKALDISVRNVSFKEKAPSNIIEEVADIIFGFIELPSK